MLKKSDCRHLISANMNVNVVTCCFLCRKEYLKNEPRHNLGTNGLLERLEAIGVNCPENARNICRPCFRGVKKVGEGEKIRESWHFPRSKRKKAEQVSK